MLPLNLQTNEAVVLPSVSVSLLESLLEYGKSPTILHAALDRIVFNYALWSRATPEAQSDHAALVFQVVKKNTEFVARVAHGAWCLGQCGAQYESLGGACGSLAALAYFASCAPIPACCAGGAAGSTALRSF